MTTKPSVVIVSSSNTKPKSLIKLVTKETPEDNVSAPNITTHPWKLETKYYTANVNLVGINEDFPRDEHFNDNVEALIVHMDANRDTGLDDLKKWEPLESDCDPEIKLLVANYCNASTKITKSRATEWCLKRGFELVELYPTVVDPEEQDIIPEKVGVDRIVEALQAHVWSNLVMNSDEKKESGSNVEDYLTAQGSDDFTELFNQLHMMKDSIQSLPVRDRKQCAEQIVTAFWNAIGGDEEEIADV